MKICYVASSGGHWEELMCLRNLFDRYESIFVTEEGVQSNEMNLNDVYKFPQINRKEKNAMIHLIKLFIQAKKLLSETKPDVIITTGAMLSFPFCLLGKLMKKKIVYIESFARIDNRSLTGRLCYPISDLFFVQWEELKSLYPKAKYFGGIFE